MNTRRTLRFGVAALVASLGGCQAVVSPPVTTQPSSAVETRDIPTSTALPPSAESTEPALQLPNPGGTCTASQFVEGPPGSSYNFSTLFSRVADAWQPLTNVGDACVLAVPTTVGMAAADSPFEPIALPNAGQQVCKNNICKDVYPASYRIASGDAVTLWLRASWPRNYGEGTPLPSSCQHPLSDVTRAMFPFASGAIAFTWETPFHEVCLGAASIGITVGNS
jgi:hypothetical protein